MLEKRSTDMNRKNNVGAWWGFCSLLTIALLVSLGACKSGVASPSAAATHGSTVAASPGPDISLQAAAQGAKPSAQQGFSGDRAFEFVAKQVAFGPRPPDTEAIRRTQEYILGELRGFGCTVETDDFHAPTPVGRLAMKNIVVKIKGASPNIILMATHYDTDTLDPNDKKLTNFVGADDAGSSTGLMMEMARILCGKPQTATIWIAFLDGEEALQHWNLQTDSVYGSRELAAKLAVSGDLAHVKAFVLADLVGGKNLHIKRESNSTPWLTDIVWATAARLGHQNIFVPESVGGIEDDHMPFVERKIPAVDIIDLDTTNDVSYWHTPQDTLDKISPRSLQIVGDVILASLPEIARHIH
jgi:glutaminyl-peptide cyclotransferase